MIVKPDLEKKLQDKLEEKIAIFPPFVVDYIYGLEYRGKELRTRLEYTKDLRLFFHFLIKEKDLPDEQSISPQMLESLHPRDIHRYFSYLTNHHQETVTTTGKIIHQEFHNSNAGKARKLACLHDFYSYLLNQELISKDISKQISIKVDSFASIKPRLTPNDMERFYQAVLSDHHSMNPRELLFHQKIKQRNYIIILLLSYTGIRISELVQLDLEDLLINEQSILVNRKGGYMEKLALPQKIMNDLVSYIQERKSMSFATNALFISLHKKRIDPRTIRVMLEKYRHIAGIDIKITPHVFRRTFGTTHYNRYRDMYLTAEIMGHRSAETTRRFYADPAEERKIRSMRDFDY